MMVRFLRTFLFVITFLGVSCSGWGEEQPAAVRALSLDDAIQTAFQNNKDLQIQALEIDAAKANILGARSQFLPQLSANAGYTHNGNVLGLGTAGGTKKDGGIFTGYNNDNSAGLSAQQIVYNGGASITQFSQAKENFNIQKQVLRLKRQDVVFETKRLYYGLLLANDTERIAQDLLNLAQSHYEEVEKKFTAGTVSKFDVLQSKVQVSKLSPELIRAKSAVDLISAELKNLLGLKMDEVIQLKDPLSCSITPVNEKEVLGMAQLSNPEMVLQSMGVDLSKLGIELARSGYRPQISAGIGSNYHSNDLGDMFNNRHQNWSAGVSVSLPIFDGFSSKAKVDEARARYTQTLLAKDNLADQIAVNVKRATLDLTKAEALISSQQQNIEEAKEAVRISQVRYSNGEGTNLDVLETQVSLSQVEKNYSEGVYDYLMAQAYLNRIVGKESSPQSIAKK